MNSILPYIIVHAENDAIENGPYFCQRPRHLQALSIVFSNVIRVKVHRTFMAFEKTKKEHAKVSTFGKSKVHFYSHHFLQV